MLATIPIDRITVGSRLREISEAQVETLMNSIAEIGLLNPVTVYPREVIRAGIAVQGYGIVAGAHRLEAIKRLGLVEIEANVVELGELHRQLAEVDENLAGTSLTASERALFTQRRKDIYLALHPETRQHVAGAHASNRAQGNASANFAPAFAAETAAKTGRSERAVQLEAERGAKIPDDLLAKIRGTHLDKGVFLDRIKGMEPSAMRALVRSELDRGKAAKASPAKTPRSDAEVEEREFQAIASLWDRTGSGARARFREYIDEAVFDASRAGRAA